MPLPTPAQALWNQRAAIATGLERMQALIEAVDRPTDLCPFQWSQVAAFALEYQPDLIVDLGRGRGNSTCCFLEAARHLRATRPCKVVSLEVTDEWPELTLPRLPAFCTPDWFAAGEIIQANIFDYDFTRVVQDAERCLVFWDVHGFELAEYVLGHVLPLMADKPHVVLMHDLCDTRYNSPPREYGQCGLWKGEIAAEPGYWLGHIFSRVAQAISIVDFATRNRIPLHSADESMHTELGSDPEKLQSLSRLLGPEFFSLQAQWFWFSLSEAAELPTFPRYHRPQSPPVEWWRRLARRGKQWLTPRRSRHRSLRSVRVS